MHDILQHTYQRKPEIIMGILRTLNICVHIIHVIQVAGLSLLAVGVYAAKMGTGVTAR